MYKIYISRSYEKQEEINLSNLLIDEIKIWEKEEAIITLKECGLSKGMNVLEFGCGMPHYTFPAAEIVGNSGIVYAFDKNKQILDIVKKRMIEENAINIQPIQSNETKIKKFDKSVQFILFYDMFQSVGKGMNGRLSENEKLFREFHRILDIGNIFSFAVYSEVTSVQDYVNGPFTPKGEPKWLYVSYEEAFNKWYKFISFIESCGFSLKNTVKNGGIHFDEIDCNFHLEKNKAIRFSDLERRDIFNFIKI